MNNWLSTLLLLAEDAPAKRPDSTTQFIMSILPFVGIAFLFYFLLIRPQKQEQRRRQDLLNQLKKNDKVVTIGGIIGTIADVSQDGSRVTLKLDENVRIKMQRTGIHGPYVEDEAKDNK